MKQKLSLAGAIAGIHYALYWAIIAILHISGYSFNFVGPAHNGRVLECLFESLEVLMFPVCLLPDHFPDVIMFALTMLNSIVWGSVVCFLYYGVKKAIYRFNVNKADAGDGSNGTFRVIDASRSPSPDQRRSLKK